MSYVKILLKQQKKEFLTIKTEIMNKEIRLKALKDLQNQKLQLVELISINLIANLHNQEKGQLNNLQQALRQNDEITKIFVEWEN